MQCLFVTLNTSHSHRAGTTFEGRAPTSSNTVLPALTDLTQGRPLEDVEVELLDNEHGTVRVVLLVDDGVLAECLQIANQTGRTQYTSTKENGRLSLVSLYSLLVVVDRNYFWFNRASIQSFLLIILINISS